MHHRPIRFLLLAVCLATPGLLGWSDARAQDSPKLLGRCTADQLEHEPYDAWFRSGYTEYVPQPDVLRALQRLDTEGVELEIFFGTWCRDSQREVPRLMKLLDALDLPDGAVHLVAVDDDAGQYKRSPAGEEAGLEIYRVPTIVIRLAGQEISRIVEYPALSLERDLLAILSGADYQPSYRTFPVVRHWLDSGLLSDPNVSADGLADRLRSSLSSEGELASPARVLLDRGDIAEAIKLYEVNRVLHPNSARHHAQLAEALVIGENRQRALELARRALELNDDPEAAESLVQLLERALEGHTVEKPTGES